MLVRAMTTGLVLLGLIYSQNALAEGFSANIGYKSEYIYRGIPQKSSSAFGGMDYENGGFSAGAWTADVGDGVEIDYYGAYGFEVGQLGFTVGGTWYTYTGDFDDDYLEINLGTSWKFLSFDVAIGEYRNFEGPTLAYQFYSLTASHNGFYGTIGIFEDEFDGDYFEAGYGNSLTVDDVDLVDYAVALIHSSSTLLGGESDTNIVFTLSKTFSF